MDAISDPSTHTIVLMKPAQIVGTEITLNAIGYFIDQDPSSILIVQPTLEISDWWSKRRLTPMLRDTPALRGKVREIRARHSDNTIREKAFDGGSLTITGANSPSGLASRPIRIVINDDTDRFPASAGSEGSPIDLSVKRSTTFWNRKHIQVSSPGRKDISNIEPAYESSDMRRCHVPCPYCDHFQVLVWGQVQWPKETVKGKEVHQPKLAVYICKKCGGEITDADKPEMLRRHRWIPEKEFDGVAGFHLNEIYSPWVTFAEMAANFLKAKKLPDTLQTFVNTSLAQTWEDKGESVEDETLYGRCEVYDVIPQAGMVLTAGVDVQDNRLECEVVAWGEDEENWGVEYAVLWGDPRTDQVWHDLDGWLLREFEHESGHRMRVSACAIDSGFLSDEVYAYTGNKWHRRIISTKGYATHGRPLLSKPSRNNMYKARVFPIGTSTAKDVLYGRLAIQKPGPGYCHFPTTYDQEYFDQLTAEKAVKVWRSGRATRTWVLKSKHRRNEALDIRILNSIARLLVKPNFARLRARFSQPPPKTARPREGDEKQPKKGRRRPRRGKYIYRGWK